MNQLGSYTFGSLFAGIGGFDLGFEQAGLRCRWQVENHERRQAVLRQHWPRVIRWGDVRSFPPPDGADRFRVDVICGGFPCQDISLCGKGAGIEGERSGLWVEYIRIVRTLRPRIVVVENVAALTSRGLHRVLGDLAESGFDAEWDCLPASAFGAYHERDRIFVVAYPSRVDGRPHDLLGASGAGRALLQSRRLFGMSVARRGRQPGKRLGREPRLARLVRRVPGALDRLEGIGNSVYPPVARWIGRRVIDWLEVEDGLTDITNPIGKDAA